MESLCSANSNQKSFRNFTIPTLFIPDGASINQQKLILDDLLSFGPNA